MKTFVKPITWLAGMSVGWGNGYLCIPKGHPLFGVDYDAIHDRLPELSVHGGLTFARPSEECKERDWPELPQECHENHWVIGFDCAHAWDTPETCPREFVLAEVERLREQIEAFELTAPRD